MLKKMWLLYIYYRLFQFQYFFYSIDLLNFVCYKKIVIMETTPLLVLLTSWGPLYPISGLRHRIIPVLIWCCWKIHKKARHFFFWKIAPFTAHLYCAPQSPRGAKKFGRANDISYGPTHPIWPKKIFRITSFGWIDAWPPLWLHCALQYKPLYNISCSGKWGKRNTSRGL